MYMVHVHYSLCTVSTKVSIRLSWRLIISKLVWDGMDGEDLNTISIKDGKSAKTCLMALQVSFFTSCPSVLASGARCAPTADGRLRFLFLFLRISLSL